MPVITKSNTYSEYNSTTNNNDSNPYGTVDKNNEDVEPGTIKNIFKPMSPRNRTIRKHRTKSPNFKVTSQFSPVGASSILDNPDSPSRFGTITDADKYATNENNNNNNNNGGDTSPIGTIKSKFTNMI